MRPPAPALLTAMHLCLAYQLNFDTATLDFDWLSCTAHALATVMRFWDHQAERCLAAHSIAVGGDGGGGGNNNGNIACQGDNNTGKNSGNGGVVSGNRGNSGDGGSAVGGESVHCVTLSNTATVLGSSKCSFYNIDVQISVCALSTTACSGYHNLSCGLAGWQVKYQP